MSQSLAKNMETSEVKDWLQDTKVGARGDGGGGFTGNCWYWFVTGGVGINGRLTINF